MRTPTKNGKILFLRTIIWTYFFLFNRSGKTKFDAEKISKNQISSMNRKKKGNLGEIKFTEVKNVKIPRIQRPSPKMSLRKKSKDLKRNNHV